MIDVQKVVLDSGNGEGRFKECQSISNTLGLSCQADAFWSVSTETELVEAAIQAVQEHRDLLPLGEGSNVVLPPQLGKTVLQVADDSVKPINRTSTATRVRVGAGKSWHDWVVESLAHGWLGLENLALIPGSVGAAPIQNIGAYGREVKEFIASVRCVDLASGQLKDLSPADCAFSYRESIFKREFADRYVISSVLFDFDPQQSVNVSYPTLRDALGDKAESVSANDVCEAVVALRKEKLPDPTVIPNVGSFFKNPFITRGRGEELRERFGAIPLYASANTSSGDRQGDVVKTSAAWLIDQCGMRGHRVGGAVVSEKHALVITNDRAATQRDVLALATQIQETVRAAFAVDLEIEPRVL
ncbi:MAG: UDP-N-acetylmuramate dehydrogenase [Pseudomonadota bacterium]